MTISLNHTNKINQETSKEFEGKLSKITKKISRDTNYLSTQIAKLELDTKRRIEMKLYDLEVSLSKSDTSNHKEIEGKPFLFLMV